MNFDLTMSTSEQDWRLRNCQHASALEYQQLDSLQKKFLFKTCNLPHRVLKRTPGGTCTPGWESPVQRMEIVRTI